MPKRNPIKRPLPPYLTSSDMVNIRAAIKAGEKRMQAAINSLEQRQTNNERQFGAHVTFMCARYDEARAMAERVKSLEKLVGDALVNGSDWREGSLIALNELGKRVIELEFSEQLRIQREIDGVELGLIGRLRRRAVAWWNSLKCNNPECAKCYPPSTYNADHPMTKGDVTTATTATDLPKGKLVKKSETRSPGGISSTWDWVPNGTDATQHCGKTPCGVPGCKTCEPPKKPCPAAIGNGSEYDANCAACRAANGEGK